MNGYSKLETEILKTRMSKYKRHGSYKSSWFYSKNEAYPLKNCSTCMNDYKLDEVLKNMRLNKLGSLCIPETKKAGPEAVKKGYCGIVLWSGMNRILVKVWE